VWLDALIAGDNARACSQLTPALRAAMNRRIRLIRVEPGDCYQWAARWIGRTKPPGRRDARVGEVSVTRGVATVIVTATPDLESTVRLREVGGRWRIDDY